MIKSIAMISINTTKKNIPAYYTEAELTESFNITPSLIEAFIDTGLLKARGIPHPDTGEEGEEQRVFLIKDNKGFLPPRKILPRGKTRLTFNAKGEAVSEYVPWYRLKDPVMYLAKYGISDFMTVEQPA